MIKKISLIFLYSSGLLAMTQVNDSSTFKLELRDGIVIEVPGYVAELSEVLREHRSISGDDTPISLSHLTIDDWELIHERLELADTFSREQTVYSQALIDSLGELSADELLSCMMTADYLAIRELYSNCLALAYQGHLNTLSYEQLSHLPPHDVHEIVTRRARIACGSCYEAIQQAHFEVDMIVNAMCVTPDGKIVMGGEEIVTVWDMQGNQLAMCEGHEHWVTAVCVTPDSKIVSGSYDRTIRVWDIEGNQLAVCKGHNGSVDAVCITPDGKIVSGSADGTIRFWDMRGNQIVVCRGHDSCVYRVCITRSGTILTASEDRTVRVWNAKGDQLAAYRGNLDWFYALYVTKNGNIVSASGDMTIRIWDEQANQLAVCKGHEGWVFAVCVTPNSEIVSGSTDKTVRLWNTEGNQLAVCRGHEREVTAVCAAPNGTLISVSKDSTVIVWDPIFSLTEEQASRVWLYLQKNPNVEQHDGWKQIKQLLQEDEETPMKRTNMMKQLTLALLCSPGLLAMTQVKHSAPLMLKLRDGIVEVSRSVAELSGILQENLN